ncbi:MAG TPA: ABC transporter ATP-binding protein [Limnochordia bacterium]|nr:ABC transporter ATP-binding protein [Limnochordia bacterium]
MIQVQELSFSYRHHRPILNNIDFAASKGQCTAILGNNGAGKSTLIKCLNRILEPQQGIVYVNGKNTLQLKRKEIARSLAYVSQHSAVARFTVFDTILLGRKPYIRFEPAEEDFRIVESVMERLKLQDYALRYIDELSGGELQKVMLARALAQQPQVLLLDEPTSNLDLSNQYEVLAIVKDIARTEQISVLLVLHDLNLALRYCDKFLFLKNNRIFCYGGIEVMTPQNIYQVYEIPVAVQEVNGVKVVIPFPNN